MMKSMREKKMLARLARNAGQPDLALEESIRREEELDAKLFKTEAVVEQKPVPTPEPVPVLVEDQVFAPSANLIQQAVEAIQAPPKQAPILQEKLRDAEISGIRRQIAELVAKMGTLSWGGGGTGVVRFNDLDDKLFVLNRIDFKNYTEVTSNAYSISKDDYYVGVNHAGNVAITLPTQPEIRNGYICVVKDESGNASGVTTWIDIYGSGGDLVDGCDYVRLQIDHGSLTFFYRDGWRII